MGQVNLSICCADGSIYGFICDDYTRLMNFLLQYDHEGSSISLVVRLDDGSFYPTSLHNEDVYKELSAGLSGG